MILCCCASCSASVSPPSAHSRRRHGKLQPRWSAIEVLAGQIYRRESLTIGDVTIYKWEYSTTTMVPKSPVGR